MSWVKSGKPLNGDSSYFDFGKSIGFSADGTVLAAASSGNVKLFFDQITTKSSF